MCKGLTLVEILISLNDRLSVLIGADDLSGKDATGKVTTIGNEVDVGFEMSLYMTDALANLGDMLMGESLVDAQVVVAPREMGGGTGLHAGSRASRDGVDADGGSDEPHLGGRQQSELNARGKATGVGYMAGSADALAVDLGQTIDEVVHSRRRLGGGDLVSGKSGGWRKAEVLCQVDDLHLGGYVVLRQEPLALAVAKAEEEHVDIVEGHLAREAKVSIAVESLMHVGDEVSGIALAVDEDELCLGMVDEQADEFSCRIAGTAKYSYSYHVTIRVYNEKIKLEGLVFILSLPDACRSRRAAEWRVL